MELWWNHPVLSYTIYSHSCDRLGVGGPTLYCFTNQPCEEHTSALKPHNFFSSAQVDLLWAQAVIKPNSASDSCSLHSGHEHSAGCRTGLSQPTDVNAPCKCRCSVSRLQKRTEGVPFPLWLLSVWLIGDDA